MNRASCCLVALMLASACAWGSPITLGTFTVNAQSTFFYQSANDINAGALFINLTGCTIGEMNCVDAPAGTTLTLTSLGELCYAGTPGSCAAMPGGLAAAFDTNNVLLDSGSLSPGNVDRLTGTVNAPGTTDISNPEFDTWWSCTSPTSCVGGGGYTDTTIPNDFIIPSGDGGLTVTVPVGAQFLVIGVLDSFYRDNSNVAGNPLELQITELPASVPEPATFALFGMGLCALALARRSRSR